MSTSVKSTSNVASILPKSQNELRVPISLSPRSFRRMAPLGIKMKTECTAHEGVRQVIGGKRPLVLASTKYHQNTARLSGSIAVRKSQIHNDMCLRVFVRYSTDAWLSCSEVDAQFLCEREFCEHGECDLDCDQDCPLDDQQKRTDILFYGFSLRLGRLSPGKRVEFVLCYEEDGVPIYRDDQGHGIKNAAEVVLLPKAKTRFPLF